LRYCQPSFTPCATGKSIEAQSCSPEALNTLPVKTKSPLIVTGTLKLKSFSLQSNTGRIFTTFGSAYNSPLIASLAQASKV
jgi:hypothetical protein